MARSKLASLPLADSRSSSFPDHDSNVDLLGQNQQCCLYTIGDHVSCSSFRRSPENRTPSVWVRARCAANNTCDPSVPVRRLELPQAVLKGRCPDQSGATGRTISAADAFESVGEAGVEPACRSGGFTDRCPTVEPLARKTAIVCFVHVFCPFLSLKTKKAASVSLGGFSNRSSFD